MHWNVVTYIVGGPREGLAAGPIAGQAVLDCPGCGGTGLRDFWLVVISGCDFWL